MYNGEHIGINVKNQQRKALILGESHHYETESTSATIAGYINNCREKGHSERCHTFFDKIVEAFGKKPENDREDFWSKVCFGNYIHDLCGVQDTKAVNLLKNKDMREKYNDALFRFVNEKGIDIIFCFSRRVYKSLPSLAKHTGEYEEIGNRDIFLHKKDGTPKKDYISHCVYLPDLSHKHTNVCLHKPLEVYGMLHPSGRYGFDPENYSEKLKELIGI